MKRSNEENKLEYLKKHKSQANMNEKITTLEQKVHRFFHEHNFVVVPFNDKPIIEGEFFTYTFQLPSRYLLHFTDAYIDGEFRHFTDRNRVEGNNMCIECELITHKEKSDNFVFRTHNEKIGKFCCDPGDYGGITSFPHHTKMKLKVRRENIINFSIKRMVIPKVDDDMVRIINEKIDEHYDIAYVCENVIAIDLMKIHPAKLQF